MNTIVEHFLPHFGHSSSKRLGRRASLLYFARALAIGKLPCDPGTDSPGFRERQLRVFTASGRYVPRTNVR